MNKKTGLSGLKTKEESFPSNVVDAEQDMPPHFCMHSEIKNIAQRWQKDAKERPYEFMRRLMDGYGYHLSCARCDQGLGLEDVVLALGLPEEEIRRAETHSYKTNPLTYFCLDYYYRFKEVDCWQEPIRIMVEKIREGLKEDEADDLAAETEKMRWQKKLDACRDKKRRKDEKKLIDRLKRLDHDAMSAPLLMVIDQTVENIKKEHPEESNKN